MVLPSTEHLAYLRRADFSFTRQLGSVWFDDPRDVPELHHRVRADILARVEASAQAGETPLGIVLKGDAGLGKTHLLGELRRRATERGVTFVYVDMTDVRSFDHTLLLGLADSLTREVEGVSQLRHVIAALFVEAEDISGRSATLAQGLEYAAEVATLGENDLRGATKVMVDALWQRHRTRFTHPSLDVIRALMGMNNEACLRIWSLASAWLQGSKVDDFDGMQLGLVQCEPDPGHLIQGIFRMLSFRGPTLMAFDQLDNCFPLLDAARHAPDREEGKTAKLVLGDIGKGFGALRDRLNSSTLTVVACFGDTWDHLKKLVPASFADRYTEPHRLLPVSESSIARDLVERRLDAARGSFSPPYSTWPFAPEFFSAVETYSPREILRACHRHRDACLAHGEVRELGSPETDPFREALPAVSSRFQALDGRLEELRASVDIAPYLEDDDRAEGALGELFAAGCRRCVEELETPENTFFEVESASGGRRSCPAIHLRWKRMVTGAGGVDAEWHVCLRVLLRENHTAYNHRLQAAMVESGIARHLSRRRLVILRPEGIPLGGKVGPRITEDFLKAGGVFMPPVEDDLRTLAAVVRMGEELSGASAPEEEGAFKVWLRERKPLSSLESLAPLRLMIGGGDGGSGEGVSQLPEARNHSSDDAPVVVLGDPGETTRARLSADDLARHVVVLAGSGSGKTVLLKRLVEEAALAGIPSVVFDSAGDLAQLGDRWPDPPKGWDPGDDLRAERYFETAEVRIWTPGCDRGRPFALRGLPDFPALRDDADAFQLATTVTVDMLTDLAVVGSGAKAKRMAGVLAAAVKTFAQDEGGDIHAFLAFLRQLPPGTAGEISAASSLAREAADNLQSAMFTAPVLFGEGPLADPEILWGRASEGGRTPVSVVSLVGVPGDRNRQIVVGHVVLSLLTWARRHPPIQAPGRMNGLVVLDEAKDFLPSVRTSACKQGLQRLAAQGRKYGLGLVVATQNPKDLDGGSLSNMSTWFCGRANTPRIIDQIRSFLEDRGSAAAEIATLESGAFHFASPQGAPHRVRVPLCLSHHPDRAPLTEEEICERARR